MSRTTHTQFNSQIDIWSTNVSVLDKLDIRQMCNAVQNEQRYDIKGTITLCQKDVVLVCMLKISSILSMCSECFRQMYN